jgi:hypothetical protein
MRRTAPQFNRRFVCIVHFERLDMAAVISSYFSQPGSYLPFFEFPQVSTYYHPVECDQMDENSIWRHQAARFATLVNNALVHLGGCEHLILAGLSAAQKSYLYFLPHYNIICIDDITDISFLLSPFRPMPERTLSSREDQLLTGLHRAILEGAILQPDPMADEMVPATSASDSLVVVEAEYFASAIIGVNYACSVGSHLLVVPEPTREEVKSVTALIQGWQAGQTNDFRALKDMVLSRVGDTDFRAYSSATFFTAGLPYSMVLKNCIPMCHVHSLYHPDLFVFNSIWRHEGRPDKAAVVFSPLTFSDEETAGVVQLLEHTGIYTRKLLGNDALLYHVDMHVKEFPFDLFHICSHGGEVDGYSRSDEFTDRDGVRHYIEFDDVVGFGVVPGTDTVRVHHKSIPRKFDGHAWGSAAIRSLDLPQYIFADMYKHIRATYRSAEAYSGIRKASIPGSCAIKCADSIYQAMFHSIASHGAPVVFNNTCWSAFGISECFLLAGARAYIGALWAVSNAVATSVAEAFYSDLSLETVMDALHRAIQLANQSSSAHIYHYWGLPFTRFHPSQDRELNRYRVFLNHIEGLKSWKRHADQASEKRQKDDALRLSAWHLGQLFRFFPKDEMLALRQRLSDRGIAADPSSQEF